MPTLISNDQNNLKDQLPIENQPKGRDENFDAIAPRHNGPMLITTQSAPKGGFGKAGWMFFLLFLIAVAALGYMYVQLQAAGDRIAELEGQPRVASSVEAEEGELTLVERVGKHMLLPSGQPQVTPVNDAAGLKRSQSLYTSVSNGDQLLTYPELEIVYNPTADVIVHVRPVVANAGAQPGAQSGSEQGVITLDVRNGTATGGLAAQTANSFKGMANYQVRSIGNAAKSSYNTTILVNLTGKNISALENQFKTAAVTQLPVGETSSTADVVIIVGLQ